MFRSRVECLLRVTLASGAAVHAVRRQVQRAAGSAARRLRGRPYPGEAYLPSACLTLCAAV